jgi:hypothetical protein
MTMAPLNANTLQEVLAFLQLEPEAPTVAFLDRLIASYVRRVPWESAFRIARLGAWRAEQERGKAQESPVRWPQQFWADALERGGGGTCFESNYAFFSLLQQLGYEGYLTINNMGETVGCHTAIVLQIEGQRWLADVGLPVYAPLPISTAAPVQRETPFHTYTVRPDGRRRFQIERDRHPKPNCFTLIDQPVPEEIYRKATIADYGPRGLFLDRVIINKVLQDVPWRFNSSEEPLHLASFPNGQRVEVPLGDNVAVELAQHFAMDEEVLRQALGS